MNWLMEIFLHNSTPCRPHPGSGISRLCWQIRFFGVSSGIAGVLFAGILIAHFISDNEEIVDSSRILV